MEQKNKEGEERDGDIGAQKVNTWGALKMKQGKKR